ncbi:hypothetical protein EIN_091050 [Entamoeba invadens IP1]|uniref:Furin repeat-containing protein n=1 Tax=Entamoeba invadens IP1 TaxID=370355 RepID=A0A0A1TVG9_ENTIV|nr:hypothetical protein EIN_091050 [Entamoeba invadens IP1]ELP84402.1 hypothetical protein EIN_091050 [Entamoeba invadens IP1]|eukprot:XP_004183748.1 hypothetical protein EIN_091050 [Entamoeba invadens IP1]
MLNCVEEDEDTCLQCEVGYQLDPVSKGCVEGNDGCLYYDTNGKCKECYFNHLLVNEKCTKCENVDHCINYDGDCKCNACPLNYYLTAQNTCETKDKYCTGFNPDIPTQCDMCISGFYLNITTYTCEQGNIKNCMIYGVSIDGVVSCSQCIIDYIKMDDNNCKPLHEVFGEHCIYGENNIKCESCDDGYYVSGKECKNCIDHCLVCSAADECTMCEAAYVFDPSTKKCEACTSGCHSCVPENGKTTCRECLPEYILQKDGTCLKSPNEAYKCNEAATTETDCISSGQNCKFETINTKTFLCTYKGSNCTTWDVSNVCTKCSDITFKVNTDNSKVCIPLTNNCKTYTSGLSGIVKCVECSDGYFMNEDFTCSKCGEMCSETCEYKDNYCDDYTCSDFLCENCNKNKGVCEKCYYNKVNEKNNCGPVACIEPVADGNCGMCLRYSEETKIVNKYTNPSRVPVTMEYFLPGLDLNCFADDNPSSSKSESESSDDLTWLWITLGVVGGLVVVALVIGAIVGVVFYVLKKKKSSEYAKIEQ